MSAEATPLSGREQSEWRRAVADLDPNEHMINITADDIHSFLDTIDSLTQQLADLRAKPAGELYTHGYFGDRSRAGELAPGHGDKEPTPADDAKLIEMCDYMLDNLRGWCPLDGQRYAVAVATALKFRLTQPSAGVDAEVEEIAKRLSPSHVTVAYSHAVAIYQDARILLRKLRAGQPARQPVTREEYCHANEKEAALLNEWLSRISQEDCDLMEALFRRTGLVYWDDPMRPKPETRLEGRVL